MEMFGYMSSPRVPLGVVMQHNTEIRKLAKAILAELDTADTLEMQRTRSPHKDSHHGSRDPSASPRTDTDEDDFDRPSLYQHKPQKRFDEFDRAKMEGTHLLDALKLRSFEGFYNLSFIMLIFSLSYIVIKNVRVQGLQTTWSHFLCYQLIRDIKLATVLASACATLTLFVYSIVKLYLKGLFGITLHASLYAGIQLVILIGPIVALYSTPIAPLPSAFVLMVQMVLMLKMHSFVATTYLMQTEAANNGASPSDDKPSEEGAQITDGKPAAPGSKRPANIKKPSDKKASDPTQVTRVSSPPVSDRISLKHFLYFLAVPCLVYEPKYPRSKRVRWSYVGRKSVEAVVCCAAQYFLMAQFILPVLRTRADSSLWFDLMKLALPSFSVWLLGFYTGFHCLCNITAELCRYADRQFYKDFWNATSLDAFWRLWNIPVHEWCHRHIYTESMHYAKVSKTIATFTTFLISAILHELLFSVAFKTLRPWFFVGMLVQIPLIVVSRYFRGTRRGNVIMWMSLFAGQPLLEILYFREWFGSHESFFCVD